jgi:hypothetical protein
VTSGMRSRARNSHEGLRCRVSLPPRFLPGVDPEPDQEPDPSGRER